MENWGLITFRESSLLFDPVETSTAAHQSIAVIIAHELAHQVPISLAELNRIDNTALLSFFLPRAVVRQLGHDEVVERFVAERRIRQLFGVSWRR